MNARYAAPMTMLYFENDDDLDQNASQQSFLLSKSRVEDANRNRITVDSEAAWGMALRQAQNIAFRKGDPKPKVKLQVIK